MFGENNDLSSLFEVDEQLDEYGNPLQQADDDQQQTDSTNTESAENTESTEQTEQTEQTETTETGDGEQQQQPQQRQKRVQTPEENARFAQMRREREFQERLERELQARLAQTPEARVAQLLSEMYGVPVDQLVQQLEEAAIQRQAQQQGVPVEVVRQMQQIQQELQMTKEQAKRLEFDAWWNRQQMEMERVKQQYPFLTDEDIQTSLQYIVTRSPSLVEAMPLEQAVFALHGPKIVQHLQESVKQEVLAETTGRKPSPLPPQSAKVEETETLSEQERYFAKLYGMSEKEYIEWRNKTTL